MDNYAPLMARQRLADLLGGIILQWERVVLGGRFCLQLQTRVDLAVRAIDRVQQRRVAALSATDIAYSSAFVAFSNGHCFPGNVNP